MQSFRPSRKTSAKIAVLSCTNSNSQKIQCFLTSFSARNLQKFQGLPRFWCTSAEQNEVCGVFSALSVKIFQAFAPVFVHNFNALVVTAVCNVKRATVPLEHVGRYDNVQPQGVGLSRKNNAFLAQTTGLRGTCNVKNSEVTSYVLDCPVTRHLKLWSLKFSIQNPPMPKCCRTRRFVTF